MSPPHTERVVSRNAAIGWVTTSLALIVAFHFSESHRHAKSMCSAIYCYKATSLGPGSFSSIKLNQTVNMAQEETYNALDDIELDIIRDTTPGVDPLNRYCMRPGSTVGPLSLSWLIV